MSNNKKTMSYWQNCSKCHKGFFTKDLIGYNCKKCTKDMIKELIVEIINENTDTTNIKTIITM